MKPIEWGGEIATDPRFLEVVKSWIDEDREIFVEFYFPHTGGISHYGLFSSYEGFERSLHRIKKRCTVEVHRYIDFPLRGIVDDAFVTHVYQIINDGDGWFLMAFDEQTPDAVTSNAYAEHTHEALAEEFKDYHRKYVVIAPIDYWSFSPEDYPGEWITAVLNDGSRS